MAANGHPAHAEAGKAALKRVGVPRDGEWKVRFNSDWNGYSPDFGSHHSWHAQAEDIPWDGMPLSIGVGLGPYTALILSQD